MLQWECAIGAEQGDEIIGEDCGGAIAIGIILRGGVNAGGVVMEYIKQPETM